MIPADSPVGVGIHFDRQVAVALVEVEEADVVVVAGHYGVVGIV